MLCTECGGKGKVDSQGEMRKYCLSHACPVCNGKGTESPVSYALKNGKINSGYSEIPPTGDDINQLLKSAEVAVRRKPGRPPKLGMPKIA